LRAKITGVTVGVLAAGLLAAGIGTLPVLQGMLRANIDSTVKQLASTNIYETLFDVDSDAVTGAPILDEKSAPPRTDYIIAIYDVDGELVAVAGGTEGSRRYPTFPTTLTVQDAFLNQNEAFTLHALTGSDYRAAVAPVEIAGDSSNALYAQLVAQPVGDADSFVGTYVGVFTTMTVITLILGALGTRLLVTLAFRRLGQVEETAMSIAEGDFTQRLTEIEPTTEVGRLKIAINTMLERVDESFAERDAAVVKMRRVIGDASHELRTPLVSVRGYAELYRMGAMQTEEDTAKAMERIEKEAKRMSSLVEDLLSLARLDERRALEIVEVDLRKVASDAALDLRAADPSRRVTVVDTTFEALTGPVKVLTDDEVAAVAEEPSTATAPLPVQKKETSTGLLNVITTSTAALSRATRKRRKAPSEEAPQAAPSVDFSGPVEGKAIDMPPIVIGAEEPIQQVVANLLGNARRYSAPDAPIELEVGVDPVGRMGWIAVVDHGEGIPLEIRDKIFERFWRADTSRTRETGGSGLGLAIVSSIVERLDGAVEVVETPGGGATFRMSFPLA
jgi:two-component system OmpR family sensor kinase